MTWNESILSPAPTAPLWALSDTWKRSVWWYHSWAGVDWLARRLPLNFRCLRSCLCRDRWCLCRWMNTLLCALPFGLNISVSNVTNQMFVSCILPPLLLPEGCTCGEVCMSLCVYSFAVCVCACVGGWVYAWVRICIFNIWLSMLVLDNLS